MNATKSPQLTRFTQPPVLADVGRGLIAELFDRFKEDLGTAVGTPDLSGSSVRTLPICGLALPKPDAEDGPYFDSCAALFSATETLPLRLRHALLALEKLASPEERDRLHETVMDAPIILGLDFHDVPERLALQLYLWAPYGKAVDDELGVDPPLPSDSPRFAPGAAGGRGIKGEGLPGR